MPTHQSCVSSFLQSASSIHWRFHKKWGNPSWCEWTTCHPCRMSDGGRRLSFIDWSLDWKSWGLLQVYGQKIPWLVPPLSAIVSSSQGTSMVNLTYMTSVTYLPQKTWEGFRSENAKEIFSLGKCWDFEAQKMGGVLMDGSDFFLSFAKLGWFLRFNGSNPNCHHHRMGGLEIQSCLGGDKMVVGGMGSFLRKWW